VLDSWLVDLTQLQDSTAHAVFIFDLGPSLLSVQVLLFNLLPPPGSSPVQPDVPGEPWVPTAEAREVQAAVVDAIEQVRTVLATMYCVLYVLTRGGHQSGWAFVELLVV
jgi:hypothetical protein